MDTDSPAWGGSGFAGYTLAAPTVAATSEVPWQSQPASAEIDLLDAEVARHEPRLALDGGPDGLDVLREIINQAPGFSVENAILLLEFTPEQADALKAIVEAQGSYAEVEVRKDLAHRPRVLKARFRG